MYIEYMHVLNISSIASMRYSSFKTISICFLYAQVEQFNHFMCCLAVFNTILLNSLKKKNQYVCQYIRVPVYVFTCTWYDTISYHYFLFLTAIEW